MSAPNNKKPSESTNHVVENISEPVVPNPEFDAEFAQTVVNSLTQQRNQALDNLAMLTAQYTLLDAKYQKLLKEKT